jgi:endonuclease-8
MEREAPVRGAPWLVLTGERAKAVLRGGSVLEASDRGIARLGPDILAPDVDLDGIVGRLRRIGEQRTIGEALLDQRVIAGIGNIWRSEALWHARVSPWGQLASLADEALHEVVGHAARLMAASRGGGRIRYEAYRRPGRPCRRCGKPINSRKQGANARTVYWCPGCQRGKERPGA